MSDTNPATHCGLCGASYETVRRYYQRRICWNCGLAEQRQRSRRRRQKDSNSVFKLGQRRQDSVDARKISGRDKILRERRIARYRRYVELGVPIEFEPRDEF
jgi:hypothetical protein